jgi:hypothetical protein
MFLQTEVYAILPCSDYCWSANMHNMTICICFDSKAALLALASYTILFKLLHQCWLSLQDLSNNNRVRLFWVPVHCDIKGNEEAEKLARMGLDAHFCGPEPCVPLSSSIIWDLEHWIALNSCRQSKLWIKHPNLQTTKYLLSLP